jgi:hypothetical protein
MHPPGNHDIRINTQRLLVAELEGSTPLILKLATRDDPELIPSNALPHNLSS